MPIQLRPTTQALNVHNKGTTKPAWAGDYSNKAKWDNDGVPAIGNTNGFYHLVTTSATVVQEYIQYGQNTDGWAAARFMDEKVTVTSQTENADGSIHVVGNIELGPIATYKTDHFIKGVRVTYKVSLNNVVVHNHSGLTGDEYLELPSPQTVNFDTTVAPQTESAVTTVKLDWVYPDHEYPDSHFVLGVALYNPNEPSYYPDSVIKAGTAWTINNNENRMGRVIRSGTTWSNIPKLPNNLANKENAHAGQQYYNSFNAWVQSGKGK